MDFTTTLPAPIVTLLPIVISPIIETFAPHVTLSPIMGLLPLALPIVVRWIQLKFLPIE